MDVILRFIVPPCLVVRKPNRIRAYQDIQAKIICLLPENREIYGSRRLTWTLWQMGWKIGRDKTRKLMMDLRLRFHYPRQKFYWHSRQNSW
ncbi:hypothetical protein FXB85_04095 [Aggregatibacter actinomycetemcomitans]|nr:hypothetical protein FXB90_07760 [Aggregatibacter actinomycetemcomitans]TYB21441.1 hypothetical protein FXB85_04095 [Aggregatibacter actinomycetemcomitans]